MTYKEAAKGSLILKLNPTMSLRVRVQDENGDAVGNARIVTQTEPGSGGDSIPADKAGSAVVPYLVQGSKLALGAQAAGYYFASDYTKPVIVGGAGWKPETVLVMKEAHRVQKGRVVGRDGKPVPRASVRTTFGPSAATDRNGEFTLENMPDTSVEVFADTIDNMGGGKADRTTDYLIIKLGEFAE